jgi:hypothetical protein
MQVEIVTKASEFLAEERRHPKGFTRVIDKRVDAGLPVKV